MRISEVVFQYKIEAILNVIYIYNNFCQRIN